LKIADFRLQIEKTTVHQIFNLQSSIFNSRHYYFLF